MFRMFVFVRLFHNFFGESQVQHSTFPFFFFFFALIDCFYDLYLLPFSCHEFHMNTKLHPTARCSRSELSDNIGLFLSCVLVVPLVFHVCVWKTQLTGCVCVLLPPARDADEREKWIHALEGTILRHTLQLRVRNCTRVYLPECLKNHLVARKSCLILVYTNSKHTQAFFCPPNSQADP